MYQLHLWEFICEFSSNTWTVDTPNFGCLQEPWWGCCRVYFSIFTQPLWRQNSLPTALSIWGTNRFKQAVFLGFHLTDVTPISKINVRKAMVDWIILTWTSWSLNSMFRPTLGCDSPIRIAVIKSRDSWREVLMLGGSRREWCKDDGSASRKHWETIFCSRICCGNFRCIFTYNWTWKKTNGLTSWWVWLDGKGNCAMASIPIIPWTTNSNPQFYLIPKVNKATFLDGSR